MRDTTTLPARGPRSTLCGDGLRPHRPPVRLVLPLSRRDPLPSRRAVAL